MLVFCLVFGGWAALTAWAVTRRLTPERWEKDRKGLKPAPVGRLGLDVDPRYHLERIRQQCDKKKVSAKEQRALIDALARQWREDQDGPDEFQ